MTTTPQMDGLPAPSAPGWLPVLACGLGTTALALGGVQVMGQTTEDFHVMGWYANYVIPIGAILVGALASSGYAFGSWLRGVKVCGGLLFGIIALQVGAYVVGQYLEYLAFNPVYEDGSAVGFVTYFDFMTRSFAWNQDDGSLGASLGVWGYGLRALEVVGFSAGSLIAPAALRGKPYCESCTMYMRKQHTVWIPASIPQEKIKKRETQAREAHEQAQQAKLESSLEQVEALAGLAERGDTAGFRALMTEMSGDAKQTEKLAARITAELFHCPRCEQGEAKLTLRTGQGQNIEQNEMASVPLERHFVRGVLQTQAS